MVEVKSQKLEEMGMEDSRDSFLIMFNDETEKQEFIKTVEESNAKGATIALTYRVDAFKNRFIEVKRVKEDNFPDMLVGVLKEATKFLEEAVKMLNDYQEKSQEHQIAATNAWKNLVDTYCISSEDETKWNFAWNEAELRSKH